MIVKCHTPTKNSIFVSENAGSCVKLVDYLNKEEGPGKTFFSHTRDNISAIDVISKIDNNKRSLKSNQDKYYMLSINPSPKEIKHLAKLTTGRDISDFKELSSSEKVLVFDEFKNYIRDCMNIYAKNFNRDKELSAEDLVYFGRIEEDRYYTHLDKEVQDGFKRPGDLKSGFQMHSHVIVSRMDVTQKIALSPLTNSRGGTNVLNGKKVKNGFNRSTWSAECCDIFGEKYNYIASYNERFYLQSKAFAPYRAKLKNKIMQEIMDDMKEEQKVIYNVKKITSNIQHPKNILRNYLRKTIRDILRDRENEI
ncbi:MAG: DUF5712 family protein [Holosporales bacterium]|jgi:hypothetical protein|nr:DUF5712 family protein [Holosporales bacterium]